MQEFNNNIEPVEKNQTILYAVIGGVGDTVKYITSCTSQSFEKNIFKDLKGKSKLELDLAEWIVFHNLKNIFYINLDNYTSVSKEKEYLKYLFIEDYDPELNAPTPVKHFKAISDERKRELNNIYYDKLDIFKNFKKYDLNNIDDYEVCKKIYTFDADAEPYVEEKHSIFIELF